MTLADSERQAIHQALAEWLDDPPWPDLSDLARKLGALPVNVDMGGALLVTPSGDVISISTDQAWDENAVTTKEADPGWVRFAHLQAARRHQSLSFLKPQRPIGSVDCDRCSATGWIIVGGIQIRCGHCFGVGWLPLSSLSGAKDLH